MDTPQPIAQEPIPAPWPQDETHENAIRITRERVERDRRLQEVARRSRTLVPHELHTSIGN